MIRKTSILVLTLLASVILTSYAVAAPPKVVCVPAWAPNPAIPHDTWSGKEITLKGTAHDPDGDITLATYEWNFGDGSPVATGTVTNPYVIKASHTYTGNIGDLFVATLKVTHTSGEIGTDQYMVEIKDGTALTVKVNVAIDEGMWRLHKDQIRSTLPDGTPYGFWPYVPYTVSSTGASTEAFEIHGSLPSGNSNDDPYVETVQRGLNYLLSQMYSFPVGLDFTYCPLGNPDVNGNGIGLVCYTDSWRTMYESSITLMAFASSRCPSCVAATGIPEVKGSTYLEIAQDMVNYIAYSQSDPYTGVYEGG